MLFYGAAETPILTSNLAFVLFVLFVVSSGEDLKAWISSWVESRRAPR